MILRDGRNQVHDLGPRTTLRPSLLKMIGTSGQTGGRRWGDMLVARRRTVMREAKPTEPYSSWRLHNLQHVRETERARSAAYRARKRSAA